MKICFIGGGNMATSIIGGLIAKGYRADDICVSDPLSENRQRLSKDFGIRSESSNAKAVAGAEVVLLAVKPQVLKTVCQELKPHLAAETLIISIAAGIPVGHLSKWLGDTTSGDIAIVRCMPNTPALVQTGATGAFANNAVSEAQRASADAILKAVGIVEWLDNEAQIDSVTAVSGSAPAYFFLLLEAMIEAAIDQGLSKTSARNLAVQTCLGAGLLAQQDQAPLSELRRRVTSPGGTTEKAIESFQKAAFEKIVKDAMDACLKRSMELAQQG
jgi:pyrroline-5-carboxylate reductase